MLRCDFSYFFYTLIFSYMMSNLLLIVSAATFAAVVALCAVLYKRSSRSAKDGEITVPMIREMLIEKGCRIIDDSQNPEWINFEFDSMIYSIRVHAIFCEVHCGGTLPYPISRPDLADHICKNELREFSCGHAWYDSSGNSLRITVFSIQKTYDHLQNSFLDMIQCIHFLCNSFIEIYNKISDSRENEPGKTIVS